MERVWRGCGEGLERVSLLGLLVHSADAEIGGDSCLRCFKWNGGGEWNGRGWNIDLPTDSQVRVVWYQVHLVWYQVHLV